MAEQTETGTSLPQISKVDATSKNGITEIQEYGGKNTEQPVHTIQFATAALNPEQQTQQIHPKTKDALRQEFFEQGLEEQYPNVNTYNETELEEKIHAQNYDLKPMLKTPEAKPPTRIGQGATTYQDNNDKRITYDFYTDPDSGIIYYQGARKNDTENITIPLDVAKKRLGWGTDINIQPAPEWMQ